MSTPQTDLILVLLKNTLEYNAGVTALATAFVGNLTTPRMHKEFVTEYKRMTKVYEKRQVLIMEDLAKKYTEG